MSFNARLAALTLALSTTAVGAQKPETPSTSIELRKDTSARVEEKIIKAMCKAYKKDRIDNRKGMKDLCSTFDEMQKREASEKQQAQVPNITEQTPVIQESKPVIPIAPQEIAQSPSKITENESSGSDSLQRWGLATLLAVGTAALIYRNRRAIAKLIKDLREEPDEQKGMKYFDELLLAKLKAAGFDEVTRFGKYRRNIEGHNINFDMSGSEPHISYLGNVTDVITPEDMERWRELIEICKVRRLLAEQETLKTSGENGVNSMPMDVNINPYSKETICNIESIKLMYNSWAAQLPTLDNLPEWHNTLIQGSLKDMGAHYGLEESDTDLLRKVALKELGSNTWYLYDAQKRGNEIRENEILLLGVEAVQEKLEELTTKHPNDFTFDDLIDLGKAASDYLESQGGNNRSTEVFPDDNLKNNPFMTFLKRLTGRGAGSGEGTNLDAKKRLDGIVESKGRIDNRASVSPKAGDGSGEKGQGASSNNVAGSPSRAKTPTSENDAIVDSYFQAIMRKLVGSDRKPTKTAGKELVKRLQGVTGPNRFTTNQGDNTGVDSPNPQPIRTGSSPSKGSNDMRGWIDVEVIETVIAGVKRFLRITPVIAPVTTARQKLGLSRPDDRPSPTASKTQPNSNNGRGSPLPITTKHNEFAANTFITKRSKDGEDRK